MKLKQLNTFFLRCQFLASKRHNLHDDLCLIDLPIISFVGESQLNVLLYGQDEFNDKINKDLVFRIMPNKADDTGQPRGCMATQLFVQQKHKKGNKTKKRKTFKAETIKGCHQGENVTILVMFTVLFQSVQNSNTVNCSMTLAL